MSDDVFISRLEGTTLVVETADGVEEYGAEFLVAALLVYIARGSGQIEPEESEKMIELVEKHFQLPSAEALELITRAITELHEKPQLAEGLIELATSFSDSEKEAIAIMSLKVIAADGRREFAEMEQFKRAMDALEVAPEIVHRAFDRFFAETIPGL